VPLMAGFGSGAYLAFLVPGLNFLAMPLLVVTGTLLALRYPPAAAGPPPGVPTPGPGAAAGRATST